MASGKDTCPILPKLANNCSDEIQISLLISEDLRVWGFPVVLFVFSLRLTFMGMPIALLPLGIYKKTLCSRTKPCVLESKTVLSVEHVLNSEAKLVTDFCDWPEIPLASA